MSITGKYRNYSKNQLVNELQDLHIKYDKLHSKDHENSFDKKLLSTDEKFNKVFYTSPDSININRLEDGMYISINRGFTKMSGYSEEEVIGKTSLDLNIWAIPEDRDKLVKGLKEKGEVENLETIFIRKNRSFMNGVMSAVIIELDDIPHILSITRDITDQKEAEIALKKSENKYRELIELAADGILIGSSNGIITGANTYILSLTGRTLAGLLGIHIKELFQPESLILSPLRFDLLQKGETVINERNILRPDKSIVPIEMHTKMMPDGTYQSIFHDISELRKTVTALRKSEEKLQSIIRVAPVGIGLVVNRILMELNDEFCSLIGYSRNELIGKSSEILYPSREEYERVGRDKYGQIAAKGTGSIESVFKCKDNRLIHVILNSTPLDRNDHSKGVTFIVLDITERKKAELAIIESEKRYRELFLNNPVPTYILDTETLEFVEVNDACIDNYGYSLDEFAHMTLKDLRLPEDQPSLLQSLKEIGDKDLHLPAVYHLRKNGEVFPVEINSHALPQKDGRRTRLVLATDISERIKVAEQMKIAKEKAEASDKLKTSFLNNISHEVRTPVNGIIGFAELILQENLSAADKKEAVTMVHESCNRLIRTITNYMDISLLTSGSMSINTRGFDLSILLFDLYNKFNPSCSVRQLDLILEMPENEENVYLESDPEILEKILSHFLDNAVKFTDSGTIRFGYAIKEKNLEFYVKDSGPGIPEKSLTRIFNRFVKEDNGSARISEGSGLGLAIAKGMAEIAGGIVHVVSNQGEGSAFFLNMPLSEKHFDSSSDKHKKTNYITTEKNTILIAEDDEINFFYLNALLSRETDSKIIRAENGRYAVETFKANKDIKLILMDIKMPEIDGIEATRIIKLLNPNIPIIAVTAYAMAGDEEKVLAAGCDGYLSKPISKELLLKKISEFVNVR
jgi:PAS domain S-box-containing protein